MRLQARFLLLVLCLVGLCEATGSQPQSQTVNLRPRARASQTGVPNVRVTVDRQRVPLGTQVTFTLTPASIVNDRRYVVTLYFGDGQTQFMRSPTVVHLYRAVGNYTYAVDVKQSGPPNQPPQPTPRVTLNASPSTAQTTEPVSFSAQLSGAYPNIQYRFVFGDGNSTAWQNSPLTQHAYARAGNYLAYVDIGDGRNRIGGSQRKAVEVSPPDALSVSLTAIPLTARLGRPVNFRADTSPARLDARYRFNFGDGTQTLWQTDRRAQHAYKSPGSYRAYVEVSQSFNNRNLSATSSPAVLTVGGANDPATQPSPRPSPMPGTQPTPAPDPGSSPSPTPNASPTADGSPTPFGSPSPNGSTSPGTNGTNSNVSGSPSTTPSDSPLLPGNTSSGNKWWYLLIAALILFLIYQASGYLFATKPAFAAFADKGVAAVAGKQSALPIDFQLLLDPNVSAGDYSVSTDEPRLVMNAPEPEERQLFEI